MIIKITTLSSLLTLLPKRSIELIEFGGFFMGLFQLFKIEIFLQNETPHILYIDLFFNGIEDFGIPLDIPQENAAHDFVFFKNHLSVDVLFPVGLHHTFQFPLSINIP